MISTIYLYNCDLNVGHSLIVSLHVYPQAIDDPFDSAERVVILNSVAVTSNEIASEMSSKCIISVTRAGYDQYIECL